MSMKENSPQYLWNILGNNLKDNHWRGAKLEKRFGILYCDGEKKFKLFTNYYEENQPVFTKEEAALFLSFSKEKLQLLVQNTFQTPSNTKNGLIAQLTGVNLVIL